ncbi:phosphoribosyl 1,2-cyclic phosphodiesterase [Chthoniobacter flavus]|uniref:response regulator n=1 Tax=Chthoniobacter flavus TaxID=191863 RepID=UPI00104F8F8F|nr:response regulator [Chthoniobacter flavus]TCO95410.1 phosphoribosyl 1,2-cyclic phosphodiesterase [Chthoniobacter flavus]
MKTILLIDDDEICRKPAAEALRRSDWQVIEAADGDEGVELAVKHRPDVILCDLLMPKSNGYHVCRTVRENPELKDTRIIVISGRDFASDRQSAAEAGADDFLVKPIELGQLHEALQRTTSIRGETKAAPTPSTVPSAKPTSDQKTVVKFWGVRGSIPTPGQTTVFFGGNTSCVEVRADGEIIILDAGSGIRPLGEALAAEFNGKPIEITLLITHTHWDHIQGFPFFLPAYDARNRVHILGYEGARDGLAATLAGQMESPYFPIALKQMPGNIVIEELREMTFNIGKVRVEACFSNHPGVCVGYKLYTSSGTIVYLPDNESFNENTKKVHGGALPRNIEENIAGFIREVDMLILDSQYSVDEYKTHVGWGHGCVDDVVRLALDNGVKRLFLFHHDPAHDDRSISNMLMHAREVAQKDGSNLRVDAAREGEQLVLGPRAINGM